MPIVELLIGLSIAYVLFYGLVNHVLRRRFGDGREESSATTTAVPRSQPSTVREARRHGFPNHVDGGLSGLWDRERGRRHLLS